MISNFISQGSETTHTLGAGERTGVLSSYQSAFGKLPSTVGEWEDCLKIANGRWPNERNVEKEAEAHLAFKDIYRRAADMDAPHDNAAVTIMTYGLRPRDRRLESEQAAIRSFRAIYDQSPSTAEDWDKVRAIAYSGATRD